MADTPDLPKDISRIARRDGRIVLQMEVALSSELIDSPFDICRDYAEKVMDLAIKLQSEYV